jgi:hypothetical protein
MNVDIRKLLRTVEELSELNARMEKMGWKEQMSYRFRRQWLLDRVRDIVNNKYKVGTAQKKR